MDTLRAVDSLAVLLLDTAVKGTVLLLLAWAAVHIGSRSSAAVRHAIWSLALVGLILMPIASAALPAWRLPILPAVDVLLTSEVAARRDAPRSETVVEKPVVGEPMSAAKPPQVSASQNLPATSEAAQSGPVATSAVDIAADDSTVSTALTTALTLTPREWWSIGLSTVWAVGGLLSGIALLRGVWSTILLRRRTALIDDPQWLGLTSELALRMQLRRPVELREHADAVVPVTWGITRPIVLLPRQARQWGESMRRAVLLHELAHVRRRDVAWQLMGRVACVLYWFHPLAWHALRRLRQEREQACDNAVVQSGEKASDYAEQLLQVARLCAMPRRLSLGVPMAEGSSLEIRVNSLFDPARGHGPVRRLVALSLVFAGTLAVGAIAVLHPVPVIAEHANAPVRRNTSPSQDGAKQPSDKAAATPPKSGEIALEVGGSAPIAANGGEAKPAVPSSSIHGRIVDEKKLGISGAELLVVVMTDFDRDDTFRVIASGVTDLEGNYSIAIPAGELGKRQMAAIWQRAAGYAETRSNSITFLDSMVNEPAEQAAMFATRGVEIVIHDASGKALPKARVQATQVRVDEGVSYTLPEEWQKDNSAITDQNGRAHLAFVDPGALDTLQIVPDGQSTTIEYGNGYFLNYRPQEAAPHFTFVTYPTGTIEGRLVPAVGVTLPKDLTLSLISHLYEHDRKAIGVHGVVKAEVDAEGRFKATDVPPGQVFIPKFLADDQPLRCQIPKRILVEASKTTQLEIPVAPGVRLFGRVEKSDTKAEVPDYPFEVIYDPSISFDDADSAWVSQTLTTDKSGKFELLVPPGPINLRLTAYVDGYSDATSWLPDDQRGRWGPRFEIPNQQEFELPPIELVKMLPIKGTVVDQDNKPLAEWTVYGFPKIPGFTQFETMNSMAGVDTNKEGVFNGHYPQTYPPAYWKVSNRVYTTPYDFDDHDYGALVISRKPLILQVDTSKELADDEEIPVDTGETQP